MKRWERIKQVNENEFEYRNGDSGVKYLMRGPSIDWGIIFLKPGESMADKAHGHAEIDETFYFAEGSGLMIVNGNKIIVGLFRKIYFVSSSLDEF